jgi:hypothetical protein
MSRTYRKKCPYGRGWDTLEYRLEDSGFTLDEALKIEGVESIHLSPYGSHYRMLYEVRYSRTSKKGKELIARWHSDAGVCSFKEPGPMWFVREFTQAPYRARCKQEIHKYYKDEDYEVIIEDMPHLDYWT